MRLILVPIFFVIAWNSTDGRDATATTLAFIAGITDYLDGMAARLTGQFSRLGSLLDPLVDRLLIVSCALVAFKFELLPRGALGLLLARELLMLLLSIPALRAGVQIKINWAGRLAVWPIMAALGFSLVVDTPVTAVLLWIGLAGAYYSTYLYIRALRPEVAAANLARSQQDLNQ